MSAQPFLLGDNDTVTSATLHLWREGTPGGTVHVDIFDDSGFGTPGVSVGRLGSIDAMSVGLGVRNTGSFTFDSPVAGLTPNDPYYLVYSQEGGTNWRAGRAVFWTVTNRSPGVGEAIAIEVPAVSNWHTIKGFPTGGPPFSVWHLATITADTSTPSPGDFNDDGQLDAADIDALASAVQQAVDDARYDLNNDGHVNLDDHTYWVTNGDVGNTYFGDANLDGEFNSGDLTLVFQAGEYEDNVPLNSTWAEGDWNGDGDFGSEDLVVAFQDGGYEMGPKATVRAVPEPSSLVMVVFSIFVRTARLRRTEES